MTDKEVVRAIEPHACIEKGEGGWLVVRKHPEGRILGSGKDGAKAWHDARMRLFGETVGSLLSEIPVKPGV